MKKITALVMLICFAALPLAACTENNPTTTTTTRAATTTTSTETTTPMASTDASSPTPSATAEVNQGNMTRYLHGKIESVTDGGMTLTDVPVYGSCEIEVDASTQLVGVTELSELEQNLHVIVGYAAPDTGVGILPDNGSIAEDISKAASDVVSNVADAVDGSETTTAAADSRSQASPSVTPGMNGGEKLVAVTIELAEPLPKLTGKITEVTGDGFAMEGTSEGTVHVVAPEGTLMEGMDQPAKGDMVSVVYNGQIGKANPARVTAISVTKDEVAPE